MREAQKMDEEISTHGVSLLASLSKQSMLSWRPLCGGWVGGWLFGWLIGWLVGWVGGWVVGWVVD